MAQLNPEQKGTLGPALTIFPVIAYAGRWVTVLRFSRRRAEALAEASIQGEVVDQHAVMGSLATEDNVRNTFIC